MILAPEHVQVPADEPELVAMPSPGVAPGPPHAACHWHCDDCGVPCSCTGDARLMPHTPCGLERS